MRWALYFAYPPDQRRKVDLLECALVSPNHTWPLDFSHKMPKTDPRYDASRSFLISTFKNEEDQDIRPQIAQVLLEHIQGGEELVGMFQADSSPDVRLALVEAISSQEMTAQRALLLSLSQQDPSPAVRDRARSVLAAMDQE